MRDEEGDADVGGRAGSGTGDAESAEVEVDEAVGRDGDGLGTGGKEFEAPGAGRILVDGARAVDVSSDDESSGLRGGWGRD